jgi:hypothetical protein
MTMFDERERAFENLFAHEEELRFRALARRNHLFARWAAEQLGLRGSQYHAYVHSFVHGIVRQEPTEALIGRVRADLLSSDGDSSEERVRAAFSRATVEAARWVRTGREEGSHTGEQRAE